jgi:putative PIN family toxin of toxin-antitoxin system
MRNTDRLVVDTNVLVSAIILPLSVPRRAVDQALDKGVLLFSEVTMSELTDVLFRQKLDRYVSREERQDFLQHLGSQAEFVPIIQIVRECRDPKDDKFLEVALNGRADLIVTGDADLLTLHPWRGVEIISPSDYLRDRD